MWLEAPDIRNGSHPLAREATNVSFRNSPRTLAHTELERLFREELSLLTLIVRRVVRSTADAEDIVQDAFVRVWRALDEGAIRSPRAVLFKTAYNLALNHLRDRRVRQVEAAEPEQEPVLDVPSAEDNLILAEDMETCRQAFDRLPFRCRQALSLRVVEELSYKEMSDRLGLSVSTLEKHYIRGRRLCRSILETESANRSKTRRLSAPAPVLAAAE